jgi:hypothetical protein
VKNGEWRETQGCNSKQATACQQLYFTLTAYGAQS